MSGFFTAVVEHCGAETAEALLRHFGGMRLYIPIAWSPDHFLNAMGDAHARRMIDQFAGERIDVPRHRAAGPRRTRLIRRLHAEGHSKNHIAREADCTARWVSKVTGGGPDDGGNQGNLF